MQYGQDEFIHACYVPKLPDGSDAVIAKVHRHLEDGTVIPHLVYVTAPKRSFYLTRKDRRNHVLKKEWEVLTNLDKHVVANHNLSEALETALNDGRFVPGRGRYRSISDLCDSPYVYGADVHIECLIKHKTQTTFEATNHKATPLTTGFFDIETNSVGGDASEPIIITVTHETQVYTAILERFFFVKDPLTGDMRRGDVTEFSNLAGTTLNQYIADLLDDHVQKNPKSVLQKKVIDTPFTYHFFVGEKPIDLIRWIFTQIHRNKTDFLGVWNLDFDIQHILTAIKAADVAYEDVLCPPEIPKRYRYVRYVRDEMQTDSIFKKWHWLHCTSATQFVDSMCLYSILRTVKGKETKYSLDNILKINDLGGKLTFRDEDPQTQNLSQLEWHRYMQTNDPYKYIIYNMFDCISLQLMEWKNNDLSSMFILGGVSRLCKWNKQTRKVSDALYFNALESGMVTASPGMNMETEFDKMIEKIGGAVLRPERTIDIGLKIFQDLPHLITMLHNMTGDFDFTGLYPNITAAMNISKETKLSTGLKIDERAGGYVQNYYSLIISLQENAVLLASRYFGLPTYTQMADRFAAARNLRTRS